MRLSIDIPDEWALPLRQKAVESGAQSVADYLRRHIQELINAEPVEKSWGGKRTTQLPQDKQVKDVTQDEEVEQDDDPPILKSFQAEQPTGQLTPAQIIAQRKAAAAVKHPLPKSINGKTIKGADNDQT